MQAATVRSDVLSGLEVRFITPFGTSVEVGL